MTKLSIYILLIAGTFFSMPAAVFSANGFWDENNTFSKPSVSSKGVSVNKQAINIAGSTTVSNILNILADRFEQRHNGIKLNIAGGGSSSAVKAMLKNSGVIGQMSRAMKQKERDAFVKHYGYEPLEFKVAVDALAVYVNKNNPVEKLTLTQLVGIFSQNHENIVHWGDLNHSEIQSGPWKKQAIEIFTLPKSSGAYSLFNKRILKKSGYKVSIISQQTSSSVIQATGIHPGAITFASSFYKTKRTHFVALEGKDGQFYQPVQPWISTFEYPLSRYLYLYINKKPGIALSAKNNQFLQFLMAKGTQTLIKRAGFYPVSSEIRLQQLDQLK